MCVYVHVCVRVCVYMYIHESAHNGKNTTLVPLRLELWAVVSHAMWVLRTELGIFCKISKHSTTQ